MENQVLSIGQMQELIELGVDTSKASMIWIVNRTKTTFLVPNEDNSSIMTLLENEHIIDSYIPTFTLQDILEMLPKVIDNIYPLKTQIYAGKFNVINFGYWRGKNVGWLVFCQDLQYTLRSAFKLLKWCLENKYI